jgi:hypothetical protein
MWPNNIKVDQYIEYKQTEIESFDSFFDYEVEVFQILRDEEFEFDVEELDVEEFDKIRKTFQFRYREPSNNIKYNIGLYSYIGMNGLSFGNFIDIEYFFANDIIKYIPNICAIMWRKTKTDEFGNVEFENWNNVDTNKRAEEFKTIPINDVFGVINEYLTYKEKIMDIYADLFDQPLGDEGKFDEYLTDEDRKEIAKEESLKKFSWDRVLYNLANGDITKYDYILGLPLIFILNHLSFKKSFNL